MTTFNCTFEEFKKVAMEFHHKAAELDQDQLDNAWHCLALHYMGMNETMWQHSAAILLQMECRTYLALIKEEY